jgi:hypothetical protein
VEGGGMSNKNAAVRLVAARRLQQFGWALVHYAQGIERAILKNERFREEVAHAWYSKAFERFRSFVRARDAYARRTDTITHRRQS